MTKETNTESSIQTVWEARNQVFRFYLARTRTRSRYRSWVKNASYEKTKVVCVTSIS